MFVKANREWLVIAHIPLKGEFVTQPLHLKGTRDNKRIAGRLKNDLEDALRAGTLEAEFSKRFPKSKALARLGLKPSVEPTLGEFAATWLSEKVQLTPSSRYDYESLLKVHILPHSLAAKRLSTIDDGDINRFIGSLKQKATRTGTPLSERRINMVIARLRSIFKTACRPPRKLISEDPMRHVENLRQKQHDADPFDRDEADRIIASAEGWERAFVTTLLYTGIRPGEALALRWDAIDWDHGLILVRQTVSRRYGFGLPKTRGSERDVNMIAPVRSALQEQRARSQLRGDLVSPSDAGTPIDLANLRARNWPRILKRAKVRPRILYQCRHTFASLALASGEEPADVAKQLGHTSLEMLFRVYGKFIKRPAGRLAALERAVTHPSPKSGGETTGRHGQ